MTFIEKLEKAVRRNKSLLCVGLDPQEAMLPAGGDIYTRLSDWGKAIIAQTADLVCCYKPNSAFYEQYGPEGLRALQDTLASVPAEIPVLLDAKRGDIGSTATAYAQAAYTQFHADAVTLSPYLGRDSITPFLQDPEKFVFILCHTSNPSAVEVQHHGTPPLYESIAQISRTWGDASQIGLVVGATQPEALERVRLICPKGWILAPGVGAQGADLEAALAAGLRADKAGMIIPVSRAVIAAPNPRAAALSLRDGINAVRAVTQPSKPDPLKRLIKRLYQIGCVQFGSFTLASGRVSPVYLDLRRLVSFPDVLALAVEAYIDQLVKLEYNTLAGVPYAALPIAAIAAANLQRSMVYPRKEAKTHGTGQMVEGVFEPGQTAVIIEDVITSGGSILSAAETLRQAGLVVEQAVVLVDREQGGLATLAAAGIRAYPVLTMRVIMASLLADGEIDQASYDQVQAYLEADAG